jgi:tetratricopeptide (TPR) repeat protein
VTRLTKRRRLLLITAGGGLAFLVAASGTAVWASRGAPVYRPGESVEGVTSDLARSLPPDYPKVVFTDVTRASGISFRHFHGTRSSSLPEDMGSGAAWADYDGDGWLDLAIANEVGPVGLSDAERRRSAARAVLYRNNRDGTFTDVTAGSGIDFRGWGMAVAWADYDNDDHLDLLITAYGRNVLYRNRGDGTFIDRSAASGVGRPQGFWTGAAWGDYDRDGFLDLYVTGYVQFTREKSTRSAVTGRYDVENPASINPLAFDPDRSLLFHNNRDGTFTERAAAAGVANLTGRGLAAAWVDLDEDGWPDLYVANDVSRNALYRNLGDGRFLDIGDAARASDYRSSMGIAVGDWNGDGAQDLFLTHWIAQENALYDNQFRRTAARAASRPGSALTFMDVADRYGLGQISLDHSGWATSFIDYDNDGKLDLFVVNGSTLQKRDEPARLVPMESKLFWNRGGRDGFFDVSPVSGSYFSSEFVGRGGAFGDYDNDGDVDVFVVNHAGPGILLRNDRGNSNGWLQVELRGAKSNRQGIGAKLRLVTGGGSQVRQVGAQSPYLSQNSLVETFGLGNSASVDTLEVLWPSGIRDVRTSLPANRRFIIAEGAVPPPARAQARAFWTLLREASARRAGGQAQRAADLYARALEINPDHEDALYHIGSMRLELGDFTGAVQAWRHLLSVNPSSARTHSQLGALYLCADADAPFQLDSAEWHLRRAHALNKEESGPLLRLGEAALMRGDATSARRYFTTVLASHAASLPAHFYAGYIAWKGGESALARAAFRRALSAPADTAAVSGEGDTRSGGAMLRAGGGRCGQLRSLLERPLTANLDREMASRYGQLDSVLTAVRRRSR